MGEIGDYWREHKEYVERKKNSGRHWSDVSLKTKTVKCECGKWLADERGHKQHMQRKGKKGHGIAKINKPPSTWELAL